MSGRISIDNLSDSLKELINQAGLTEEQVINLINTNGLTEEQVINLVKNNLTGDLTQLNTTNKTNIVEAINELFQSANNGKQLIANAIGEPLSVEDTFQAMSTDINSLLATFKTNMMNNGITVDSGDRFKSLIDKIATMVEEGSGKGIQFASGITSNNFSNVQIDGVDFTCLNISLNFKPTILIVRNHGNYGFYIEDFYPDNFNIVTVDNGYDEYRNVKNYEIDKGNNNYSIPIGYTIQEDTTYYWAVGVGEEDTTLRDSLASILEEEGVSVTEEDDMASLITKVDEEFDNKNANKGLDIISATELPATGKENQICVITDNPVDSFVVSSDSNNFASGSIGVLLEANNPVLGGNITLSSNNIITNYPIYKIYQNNTPMNSFYWSNGMWNKLTIDYLYLVNNGKLENTNYFGSIASGNAWEVTDSGLVTGGNDTYVNQFTSFSNLINFNHFKKVDITFTSSKTNSSNYKPSIYVGSFKTVVNDTSSTTSSYPVAHMNRYKLANNLTCSAGVAQTVTLDISAITGEYYFGFAFISYTGWTITVSNIRLY